MSYQPDPSEQDFLLFSVLDAEQQLHTLPQFADVDRELMGQVLHSASKWTAQVIAPLSQSGDEEGCSWSNSTVRTPKGFKAAYESFCASGWPALSCAPQDGGQGLPHILESVLYEWLWAANHAWTMSPGLLHGAYACLRAYGNPALQARYLPELVSGVSLPTMCLTEAHAGSDLGLIRTTACYEGAHALGDLYRIRGSKIFITGGEHDWTDNILHLVLAREHNAPQGPKGLSLFLVPKYWHDDAGMLHPNNVVCDRIENKMGLHGSPTCSLHFDNAQGWLIGSACAGLNAMFVMMNAARLNVALQGVGLLDHAWQKAHTYAQQRRQMRVAGSVPTSRGAHDSADLLIEHPALQRTLETQRAWIDAGRVLAYQTALELDMADSAPTSLRRTQAQQWCAMITPILKTVWTQQAFDGASQCLQVLGGHGYMREWGIEQIVRDARVSMIYEGSNEIQAVDLLTRKIIPDQGHAFAQWLLRLCESLDMACAFDAQVLRYLEELRDFTTLTIQSSQQDIRLPSRIADDLVRCLGVVLMGWAWVQIAKHIKPDETRWQAPLQVVQQRILAEFPWRMQMMKAEWPHL